WAMDKGGGGTRFNEAEADKPRMLALDTAQWIAIARASMRPRQISLGCSNDHHTRLCGAASFNEAEADKPRMPPIALTYGKDGPRASMRPRQISLGCAPRGKKTVTTAELQ